MLVFALVALPLSSYVAGYLWLGKSQPYDGCRGSGVERVYPLEWEMTVFQPAGRLEAWLRGEFVIIVYRPSMHTMIE